MSAWKGKRRATPEEIEEWRRDSEADMGSGAGQGIVLKLDYVGSGPYDQTYTLPVSVGSNNQPVSLQIDTGSSDLWVVSSSCSSCSGSGHKYDPSSSSSATSSTAPFTIQYLQGTVDGTIYWDTFNIGGYGIENQALAAASKVASEPLSNNFNGVLGLALPQNSIITSRIPATDTSAPDGAQFTTNLFAISPHSSAPAARFISLTLSRPGSNTMPSLLGIGKHPPSSVVPSIGDGGKVQYSVPLASANSQGFSVGTLFWKTNIQDITVWVDNTPRRVQLTRSGLGGAGSPFPSAVIDSGVPLILSTRAIANAIYGAIGISPSNDGSYYVPCKTPLNLTITLDDRTPISIHPLDLTIEPPQDSSSPNCIGLIQAADDGLQKINQADMILGVPFIRNTYMVMAYQIPDANGSFPDLRFPDHGPTPSGPVNSEYKPRLGLQALTDPAVAMTEFHRVRVEGLPMNGGGAAPAIDTGDPKHMSVGLGVLIGLVGFIAVCMGLFGLRWFLLRRKYQMHGDTNGMFRRDLGAASDAGANALSTGAASGFFGLFKGRKQKKDKRILGNYELAFRRSSDEDNLPHEDVLRQRRFEAYKDRKNSEYSTSTTKTRVGSDDSTLDKQRVYANHGIDDALSDHDSAGHETSQNQDWNPAAELDWGTNRNTLVGVPPPLHHKNSPSSVPLNGGGGGRNVSPEREPMINARDTRSERDTHPTLSSLPPAVSVTSNRHSRNLSGTPLLPQLGFEDSPGLLSPTNALFSSPSADEDPLAEMGYNTMAGVGSGRRSTRIDPNFRVSLVESMMASSDDSRRDSTGAHTQAEERNSQNHELERIETPVSAHSQSSVRPTRSWDRPSRPPSGPRQSTKL